MDLILWRHADAAPDGDDLKRELTEKGKKQAARMAAWLKPRLDGDWLVLASPAVRACHTADALGREYDVRLTLSTDATPSSVLREAHWPDGSKSVIVVGHQPTLGQIAARLLTGQHGELSLKKGAIWWFGTREDDDGIAGIALRAVLSPDLL